MRHLRPVGVAVIGAVSCVIAAAAPMAATSKAPVFGPPLPVATLAGDAIGSATELETGDLNGDSLSDVVVTRITYPPAHVTHPIGIFLADRRGGFKDGSAIWTGAPARTEWGRQIVMADFNGDRRNDIFVADHGYDAEPFPGHANALALSTTAGKLVDASANLPPESGFSHSAAAADANGDGSTDLYVGNLCCGDTGPEILLNDGAGHFTRRLDLLPADVQDVRGTHRYTRSLFVDANGDRSPDLVLGAENNTTDSRVLLNDGSGHFHDASAPLPSKPFGPTSILISLATLDVNDDGKPDLIAGFQHEDFTGRRLQVLVGNGDGTFRDETPQRLRQQDEGREWPQAIRLADFSGDGRLDLGVVVNGGPGGDAPLYIDNGRGGYDLVPFRPANWLFGIVDANHDRHPDIFSTLGGNPEQHDVQLEIVPPAAPRNLRATPAHRTIRLVWKPVAGATRYEIWRSTSRTVRHRIGRTTATRFLDRHATSGISYAYVVRALNAAGTGPFSIPVRRKRR